MLGDLCWQRGHLIASDVVGRKGEVDICAKPNAAKEHPILHAGASVPG